MESKYNMAEVVSIRQGMAGCFKHLIDNGKAYKSAKWQAIDSPDSLFEVTDIHFKVQMPETIEKLEQETKADLPWVENHFKERVRGIPANPGYEYQNWPYYKPEKHNNSFRAEGEGYFSHTYMERFWPNRELIGTGAMGYRFGDFQDVLDRLARDPQTRQAYLAIWHPNDQANLEKEVRLPCTIGYQFLIREGKLSIIYTIRSCDILRHFKNDVYMTIRLAQYVRDYLVEKGVFTELSMGTMGMSIGSLHCFNIEKPLLEQRLKFYSF